jgi:hypothetical protein
MNNRGIRSWLTVRRRGAALLLFALLAGPLPELRAAAEADGRTEFESATRRFKAEDYRGALEDFEASYRLSHHRPSSTRGLAQCERALGLFERAIVHFEEYLESGPSDASAIRETIKLLEAERAKARSEPATAEAPPSPPPTVVAAPPPPAPETALVDSPFFWLLASGVVLLGGGLATAFVLSRPGDPSGGTTGVILRPPR